MTALPMALNESPTQFSLPVPMILCSADLEVFVTKGAMLPSRATTMTLLSGSGSCCLATMDSSYSASGGKKRVTVLDKVIDHGCSGEMGLWPHSGGEEEYVWNTENPSGCLLVMLCPVIKDSEKLRKSQLRQLY